MVKIRNFVHQQNKTTRRENGLPKIICYGPKLAKMGFRGVFQLWSISLIPVQCCGLLNDLQLDRFRFLKMASSSSSSNTIQSNKGLINSIKEAAKGITMLHQTFPNVDYCCHFLLSWLAAAAAGRRKLFYCLNLRYFTVAVNILVLECHLLLP